MSEIEIRLILEADRESIVEMTNDLEMAYTSSIPNPYNTSDVNQLIDDNKALKPERLSFSIINRDKCVGVVTLKKLHADDGSGELSYWIGTAYRGRGLAQSAARLALEYAFGTLSLTYVHAHFLSKGNPSSGRILEKIGFVLDESRKDIPAEGKFAERFPNDVWTFRIIQPTDQHTDRLGERTISPKRCSLAANSGC